jgi:hypothetical protein
VCSRRFHHPVAILTILLVLHFALSRGRRLRRHPLRRLNHILSTAAATDQSNAVRGWRLRSCRLGSPCWQSQRAHQTHGWQTWLDVGAARRTRALRRRCRGRRTSGGPRLGAQHRYKLDLDRCPGHGSPEPLETSQRVIGDGTVDASDFRGVRRRLQPLQRRGRFHLSILRSESTGPVLAGDARQHTSRAGI